MRYCHEDWTPLSQRSFAKAPLSQRSFAKGFGYVNRILVTFNLWDQLHSRLLDAFFEIVHHWEVCRGCLSHQACQLVSLSYADDTISG